MCKAHDEPSRGTLEDARTPCAWPPGLAPRVTNDAFDAGMGEYTAIFFPLEHDLYRDTVDHLPGAKDSTTSCAGAEPAGRTLADDVFSRLTSLPSGEQVLDVLGFSSLFKSDALEEVQQGVYRGKLDDNTMFVAVSLR